jgi:hypothetical protein
MIYSKCIHFNSPPVISKRMTQILLPKRYQFTLHDYPPYTVEAGHPACPGPKDGRISQFSEYCIIANECLNLSSNILDRPKH